jgi:hypothetical protein
VRGMHCTIFFWLCYGFYWCFPECYRVNAITMPVLPRDKQNYLKFWFRVGNNCGDFSYRVFYWSFVHLYFPQTNCKSSLTLKVAGC